MASHGRGMSATFIPGAPGDDYYQPAPPELVAPEPQRHMPEMSNQIQHGLQNLNLASRDSFNSIASSQQTYGYGQLGSPNEVPHLSPFPKLVNPGPNVPPSDEELEATLENARALVLGANDPEMQLAWAADALIYVGVCVDNEDRIAAIKPQSARSSTPRIEHQLKTDAMNIVSFLADQHHPKAEFLRGMWLEWGRFGQREDKKEAFRCYSRAADRGYARAEYRIGMLYESYNDPVKALRHYHRGVDAGDAASCYRLGMMTLRGQHGQPQDYGKAIDLIKHSAAVADENAAQGAYVYGMLLARQLPQVDVPDTYLPFDERQARINIEKAAYLKFAKAQLKMGSAYELGSLGCEFNPSLSMHYNALASKQGEAEADMALSKWFLVGSEGVLAKNEELSYTYAQRAAHTGLATAEFALGYFNEIGMYVPVDLEKSREWYEKASKHGNADAKGRLDALARKQVLSRKDHDNIAVKRITSMYGSKRGGRPQRFTQPHQPSPLADSPSDDASVYSQSPATPAPGPPLNVRMPSAPPLTTPYPMDDGPPPAGRAPSVAPYPLEDGPPRQRVGPAVPLYSAPPPQPRPVTALNPDLRPSSAFQINPEIRANSTMSVPQLHYQQPPPGGRGYPPSGYPPNGVPPMRPATTLPPNGVPQMRPATTLPPNDPRGRYGPAPTGQRIVSGPAGIPNGNPRPGPSASVPPPQSQTPQVDIGYSAPHDDRRRQYGPRPSGGNAGPGASPAMGNSPSMPALDPTPKPSAPPGRASAPSSRPSSRPPTDLPGRKPVTLTDGPASASKPTTPTPAAKPAAKPPGKGPKTFEEMGVPQHKQEGECAVM